MHSMTTQVGSMRSGPHSTYELSLMSALTQGHPPAPTLMKALSLALTPMSVNEAI